MHGPARHGLTLVAIAVTALPLVDSGTESPFSSRACLTRWTDASPPDLRHLSR
jgi:hypothetical protein